MLAFAEGAVKVLAFAEGAVKKSVCKLRNVLVFPEEAVKKVLK